MDKETFMREHRLFQNLPPEVILEWVKISFEKEFKKGEMIFRKEAPANYVWIVKSGRIHLSHYFWQGLCQTVCVATKGDIFCCVSSLDLEKYPSDAVAATDCIVVAIPNNYFHKALESHPGFLNQILVSFCRRIRATEAKLCAQRTPVRNRIAQALVGLSQTYHQHVPMTRQELADLAGTTLETAIRTLSDFSKQGWIRSRRGMVQIVDLARMQELSEMYTSDGSGIEHP